MADHVHDEDAGGVQAVDDGLGRDADGADEEAGAALDGDVDELVQLAVGVVVVGLAGAAADLGQGEVDAERQVRRRQVRLELGHDGPQLVRRVHEAADDAEPARVGHGRRQEPARRPRHAG